MNWNCPHCNTNMVIDDKSCKENTYDLVTKNSDGGKRLKSTFYICSNDHCNKLTLIMQLGRSKVIEYTDGSRYLDNNTIELEKTWNLIPESKAKVFPDYIPKSLLNDYKEACLIKDLSPKASATLSRRCLQGLIRDFWNIKERNLYLEIDKLKDIVDPLIFKAIDATRKIGNIGAHMKKDINLIIDVEPIEAEKLLNLIEILFKECYITKYEREKELESIIQIGEEKEEAKKNKVP